MLIKTKKLNKKPDEKTIEMTPMRISKEIGKFGYNGKIPASFIRYVYLYDNNNKKWMKYTVDKILPSLKLS